MVENETEASDSHNHGHMQFILETLQEKSEQPNPTLSEASSDEPNLGPWYQGQVPPI